MPKQITLTDTHHTIEGATVYRLKKLLIQYDIDTAIVMLEDQTGRGHSVKLSSIPATTQEAAILALVNNGVLAGPIDDIP